ncbi:MAG: hypothetical protein RLN62_01660 [Rickettsiales bacterium]
MPDSSKKEEIKSAIKPETQRGAGSTPEEVKEFKESAFEEAFAKMSPEDKERAQRVREALAELSPEDQKARNKIALEEIEKRNKVKKDADAKMKELGGKISKYGRGGRSRS